MKSELTYESFDDLLKKHFQTRYQASFFDRILTRNFDKSAALSPGALVQYTVRNAIDADVLDLLSSFRKKYDCDYCIENGSISFTPIFSDIENTYWEKHRE